MILLKLPDVKGDSTIADHPDWIACDSCSWAIEREFKESAKAGTQDLNLGVADLPPIEFSKNMDRASVPLMQNSIAGGSLGTAEIHFVSTSGVEGKPGIYLAFKLDNAIVRTWSIEGSEDERPTESFSLHYQKIWMNYFYTKDGKTYEDWAAKGWDTIQNKEWNGK